MNATPRAGGTPAERGGAAAWACLCAAVILLPHLLHAWRHGLGAFPLADGVDAPMYYVLAARAPSPAGADTAYAHAFYADSGLPLPRRYAGFGALAWAASLVGLGGTRLLLLMDIVCPLAFFWLLYRWLRELGVEWGLRIAACAWLVVCHTWFIQGLHVLMRGYLDVPFLHLNRPLNPQWSLLWCSAGLYLLWRYTQAPSLLLQSASALCGLYAESIQGPYLAGPFWIAWLFPVASQWRRRDWRALAAHGLWLACATLLLKLLIMAEQAPGHFLVEDPPAPASLAPPMRWPLRTVPVVAGWTLAAACLFLRPWAHPALRFLLWAHVAVLVSANQHVVTGKLHHPDHFIRVLKVTIPLLGCAALTRLSAHPRFRWARLGIAGGHAAALVLLINGAFVQIRSVEVGRATVDTLHAYRRPLAWLAGQPQGVVSCYSTEMFSAASSYRTPTAVLLTTHHWVLSHTAASSLGYPVRERVARWVFERRLRGAGSLDALRDQFVRPHGLYDEMTLGFRVHSSMFGIRTDTAEAWHRDTAAAALVESWNRPPPFRVDYVIEGPFEREEFGRVDPEKCPHLRLIYPEAPADGGDVRMYRVDAAAFRTFLAAP